ncbi:MAG: DUF4351 domain-containing protein [Blastocatellia bacterium]
MTPDYDSPWKDLLDQFFEAFMEFFFPEAHAQIDWTRGVEFLDKELQKITADAALGRRTVDKLVKVWLKTGAEIVTLVHTEVQGDREPDFEHRVYIYHSRISDRFNAQVATFVVLTDRSPNWRPEQFSYELLGTKLTLQFSMVKFLDYRDRWDELEQSRSPFAVVVMAYLRMIETRRDPRRRLHWKLTLTKMLYDRGYDGKTINALFQFLDWVMFLPKALQREYRDEMERFEEECKMPYVTTIERMGIEQGLQQGGAGLTIKLLQVKLGQLDERVIEAVRTLPLEKIEQLATALLAFATMKDLNDWLENHQVALPPLN